MLTKAILDDDTEPMTPPTSPGRQNQSAAPPAAPQKLRRSTRNRTAVIPPPFCLVDSDEDSMEEDMNETLLEEGDEVE